MRPLRHDMLQRLHLTDGRRVLFVVRERRQPSAGPDQIREEVLSVDALDEVWMGMDTWPAEIQAILVDPAHHIVRFTTGVWNAVPLYLAWAQGRVEGSWDPVDLYRGRQLSGLDRLTVARALTYWHRYGHRTLHQDVIRLTERATVTADQQGLRVAYPPAAQHSRPRPMRDGADPLPVFAALLEHAVTDYPVADGGSVVELSGGMDSACVAVALSRRSPGRVTTTAMLIHGMVGAQQRARRTLMVQNLGLGPDLTVPAWRYPPFCRNGGRDDSDQPFDPCGEPYLEATQTMLAAVAGAGVRTVWCGVGGDELMALRREERNQHHENEAREFADWVTADAAQLLMESREDVAPTSVINEVTLMAMACAAPRYLRTGLWTLVPLAQPDLIRFCEWLPAGWRRRKTLMRRYMAGAGLPDVVVHPPLHENLAPVMQLGLRHFGVPRLRRWMPDLILADLGLVNPDKLRPAIDAADTSPLVDQRLYPLIALEAGLRSLTAARSVGVS